MKIIIETKPGLVEAMRTHFDAPSKHPQQERAAVLIGARKPDHYIVTDFIEVANTHPDPTKNFSLRKKHVEAAVTLRGYVDTDIVGCLHTHPHGSPMDPSVEDVHDMVKDMLGIVYHVRSRRLTYFTYDEGFVMKEDV